jgi:hypothetical protein
MWKCSLKTISEPVQNARIGLEVHNPKPSAIKLTFPMVAQGGWAMLVEERKNRERNPKNLGGELGVVGYLFRVAG